MNFVFIRSDSSGVNAVAQQEALLFDLKALSGRSKDCAEIAVSVQTEMESFQHEHGHSPAEEVEFVEGFEGRLLSLEQERTWLHERLIIERSILETKLRKYVEVLAGWGLCPNIFGSVSEMLETIEAAHTRAVENTAGIDLDALQESKRLLDDQMQKIESAGNLLAEST